MGKTVIVAGGGAAGLMAALAAARAGANVTVLEANDRPGRKLLATGNGRCNLTNVRQSKDCYRGSDPAYAWELIRRFPMAETVKFFTELGLYTKNRDGWLYPNSDQASGVLELLLLEAAHRRVKIKTRERVERIARGREGWEVQTSGWTYRGDAVIVTCGSPASSVEGSSDFGMRAARELGISVVPPLPALCGLKGRGNFFSRWAGVRAQAAATLLLNGIPMKTERGEIQLTDYGVSGIPVFQLSRYAVRALDEGCTVGLELDFIPDLCEEALTEHLERRCTLCPYKTLSQQLIGLVHGKLIPLLAPKNAGIPEIVRSLKRYPVEITGPSSLAQAQVCSGGVRTEELDGDLQSKKHPGLYFAGEVVDVDGACGGYNLQWAWSSGAVAGRAAAQGTAGRGGPAPRGKDRRGKDRGAVPGRAPGSGKGQDAENASKKTGGNG